MRERRCDTAGTVGVIRHAAQSLTLLAARGIGDGAYASRAELEDAARRHRVPVVHRWTLKDHHGGGIAGLEVCASVSPAW